MSEKTISVRSADRYVNMFMSDISKDHDCHT